LIFLSTFLQTTTHQRKMSRGGGGRGGMVEGKIYVGGLPEDATSEEVFP
jgi:hypothetical protein